MMPAATIRDLTSMDSVPNAILFILKGYPRLSETFIAQEIRALETLGLDIRIASLRHPTDPAVHPVHREIRAPVVYLPEYLYQEPWRVLRSWWRGRRRLGYAAARRAWLKDLRRDATPNRVRRFGQALVLVDELPTGVSWLHAHFIHTPGSVARYASLLSGLPWSCSAHAKDIWTTPEWEKREKLAAAAWAVTCTMHGRDHLAALAPAADRVALVYHGLDFHRFDAPESTAAMRRRDGADRADARPDRVPGPERDGLQGHAQQVDAGEHRDAEADARPEGGEPLGGFQADRPPDFEQAGDEEDDPGHSLLLREVLRGRPR